MKFIEFEKEREVPNKNGRFRPVYYIGPDGKKWKKCKFIKDDGSVIYIAQKRRKTRVDV